MESKSNSIYNPIINPKPMVSKLEKKLATKFNINVGRLVVKLVKKVFIVSIMFNFTLLKSNPLIFDKLSKKLFV